MFDLEKSISNWRQQMFAAGIESPVPLEELECHLREEIERQMKGPVDEPAAFKAAVQKIGPAHAIQDEFRKIKSVKSAMNWRCFEILCAVYILLYPGLVAGLALVSKNGCFSGMTFSQQISSLTAALAFSLLAWMVQISCGKFPAIRAKRIRDAVFVPITFWLAIFAWLIMAHTGLAESRRAVVSLWGFVPFGILFGWLWGFAIAVRKKAGAANLSAGQI